ncbi:MAG TPA: FAD:protein FMN transferase [Thermoanaerobaculia bacterium]|nr:FAD:protein FMN transferase [Thermoanaerobaculia bacterium]
MRINKSILTYLASIFILFAGIGTQAATISRARYLMGTVCEIAVPQTPAAMAQIDAAFAEGKRIETAISTWTPESELSRLNSAPEATPATVSPELYELLQTAMGWCTATGGAFNPLVAPLIEAWAIRGDGAIPSARAIDDAVRRARRDNVSFGETNTIVRTNGAKIEEGAFGKGYAIDRMLATLRERGATEALINFGGQIGMSGTKAIEVTIAHPERRSAPVVALTIDRGSLSTSSGSEKTFEIAGRRFSHLLDPRTGQALPPRGSASVLCDDALTADILSTALYVMGPEEGIRWAEEHRVAALFLVPLTGAESRHYRYAISLSSAMRSRVRSLRLLDASFTIKE